MAAEQEAARQRIAVAAAEAAWQKMVEVQHKLAKAKAEAETTAKAEATKQEAAAEEAKLGPARAKPEPTRNHQNINNINKKREQS